MLPFADSPHGRLTPSTASFTRWTRRPRAGGGPLPHAARLQAGKDSCSRCRPFTAERSFRTGLHRGLARLPYLDEVATLRDFSSLRYLTLAIGAPWGMGGRVPGETRPPGSFLLGKRSHAPLGHWHCHSVVNVRGGTLRSEWQCSAHCHPASSVPKRYDQGRVAVRPVRSGASGSASGTLGGEWQYVSHCHSTVNVPRGASHTATRRRAYRNGTIRAEWQCVRYVQVRVAVQAGVACDPLTHSNCADTGTCRA